MVVVELLEVLNLWYALAVVPPGTYSVIALAAPERVAGGGGPLLLNPQHPWGAVGLPPVGSSALLE